MQDFHRLVDDSNVSRLVGAGRASRLPGAETDHVACSATVAGAPADCGANETDHVTGAAADRGANAAKGR